MADFCPVEFDFRDSSSLYEYEASELVEYIHSWPRFGISKEFPVSLFTENEDDGSDANLSVSYLTGVFMWSFIFSSVLIIYMLILSAYNVLYSGSNGSQTAEGRVEDVQIDQSKLQQKKGKQLQLQNKEGQAYIQEKLHDKGSASLSARLSGVDEDHNVQEHNQPESEHILRQLQTKDAPAALPQSQFISPTVSRKRLLEAYFDSIMSTSTMLKSGLTDGSLEGVRQQQNERCLRIATSHPSDVQSNKTRQRWTFSKVFTSPREEDDDDDSTFQPPRRAQIFGIEDRTIAFNDKVSRAHEVHCSESHQTDDREISPRTAATGSSGSDFDDQQVDPASIHRAIKRQSADQESEPGSCFKMLTLLSGFMLLLFSCLLCSDGLLPLGIQSDLMIEEWHNVIYSAIETEQIVNDVQDLQSSLYKGSTLLIQTLNMSCPSVQPSLCVEVGDSYTCNVTGIPLHENWEVLLDIGMWPMNITTRSQETYNWNLANHDLTYLTTMPFETVLKAWQWILRAVAICNATLFFLALLVLWSIAIPKRQHAVQDTFVRQSRTFFVLFWISTVLIWIFAIMSLAGTFVLSDFCIQSPSENTIELMFSNTTNAGQSFLSKEFWNYHIDGCPLEEYPDSLQEEIVNWSSRLGPTRDLHDALRKIPTTQFELICGAGSGELSYDLRFATSYIQTEICSLVQTLTSLRLVLECKRWSPQFESIVYQGVCEHGTNEAGWTAMAEWIIVVMSLTIWTFQESFRGSTNRNPTHRSTNSRQQHKQLHDDRLGKSPINPTHAIEAPFVGMHQHPNISAAPTHAESQKIDPTNSQFLEVSSKPVDPPEFNPTIVDRNEIMSIEAEEPLNLQSFPNSNSATQNRTVEKIRVKNTTQDLELHTREQNGEYETQYSSGIQHCDTYNTLPVPVPRGPSAVGQAASSRFQIAGYDCNEDNDLESL
ncbi:unnamed protein product [Cylindrotheca closterium]|uniref:Uncharacterized protein n=1 Tax=Cylindrotheca closterium TaxID=2856 RepID=A0AAD2G4Q8_9STRA|nr:unnamed protein product [Cylindrotheca closterium]